MSDEPISRLYTGTEGPASFPRQFSIMADTHHGDIEILRAFRDTFRRFAEAGGTHLVFEAETAYQEIYNAVRSGQGRLDDFADVMHASAYMPQEHVVEAQHIFREILQTALNHNMTFIAIDQRPSVMDHYPDISRAIEELTAGEGPSFEERMRDPNFQMRFTEYRRAFTEERRQIDAQYIAHIQASVGPNDRAMIYFGADHAHPIAQGLGFGNVQAYFIINPLNDIGRAQDQRFARLPIFQAPHIDPTNTQAPIHEKFVEPSFEP